MQLPTFNASDFGIGRIQYGAGGDNGYEYKDSPWGLLNGAPYGEIGTHMAMPSTGGASSNYQINSVDPSRQWFDLSVKSGDKEGSNYRYNLVNGQYVPDAAPNATHRWDTNASTDNRGLATVLGAGVLGAGMGALAAGGAGAAAGGAVAPGAVIGAGESAAALWPGATGLAAGGGAAGVGAAAPYFGGAAGGASGLGGAGGGAAGGGSMVPGAAGAGSGATGAGGMDWLSTIGQWGGAVNNWMPAISALLGGVEGSRGTTTTSQSGPPDYLRNAGIAASQIPFQPYGQGVEGLNADQQAAFNAVRQRAAGPGGVTNPMFGLDNPYTQKAIDATTSDMQKQFNRTTAPMLDAMNSRANTGFGTSSAVDEMRTTAYQGLNDQMGQVSNDMRMQDLRAQQQMGEGYANRAPAMQAMDYRNAEALLGVGNQQQQFGQANRDFDYQEFMRAIGYPDVQLGRLGVGNPNVSTQTQPGAGWLSGAIGGYFGGQGVNNVLRGAAAQQPQQQQYQNPRPLDWNDYQWGG